MSTLHISKAMPRLQVEAPVQGAADVELAPQAAVLGVLLPGELPPTHRLGVDGMGTVLVFDERRSLRELLLDLLPVEHITLIDAEWAGVLKELTQRARPATVRLVEAGAGTPVAEYILFSEDLSLAVLLFYWWSGPEYRDERSGLEELELIEAAGGLWLGLDPQSGRLGAVLVADPARRMWIRGAPYMATPLFDALHRAYYERPSLQRWLRVRRQLQERAGALDEVARQAWIAVADSYEADLRVADAL